MEIKELMMQAIEYPRPAQIEQFCLPIWNQPFFYKIDKAQALTISYNPTDNGAKTNYPEQVRHYKDTGLNTEEIFGILYNFKKEVKWRKCYDLLFDTLGIKDENVAHMDVSFFPYRKLDFYLLNRYFDDTNKFLFKAIELLSNQLKYIFIDGARNIDIVHMLNRDYTLIDRASLPINSGKPHPLLIYRHKTKNTYLIYYGCFLYGQTCPSEFYVKELAKYIATVCAV